MVHVPNPIHPRLRGNLESRRPGRVLFDTLEEAEAQVAAIVTHVEAGGITDAGCGHSVAPNGHYVHYWRGEWSPWPAPAAETRKVGP